MRFYVGTSGYGYKEWKGRFYPAKMQPKDMLGYYSERFAAVEINGTFRRMPTADAVAAWLPQTPKSFRFVLKAPQVITHFKRLKSVETETDEFLRVASVLGRQLGPLFFQLPPNFKKDLARLEAFLAHLGKKPKVAFEFRHPSWFDEELYACLRKYRCALCLADTDEEPVSEIVGTAPWGYLRLRRKNYTARQLKAWIARIRKQKWKEAYVFFKHEETGTGPKFSKRFVELAAE